jgi:large subunit ribosomal protein L10
MNRTQKQDLVATLTTQLTESPSVYLTDFTGISVNRINELRRRFRAQGAQYVVVKNTLVSRALEGMSIAGLENALAGPTGVVLTGSDPVPAAKVLADFQREEENRPAVKAGLLDGQVVGPEAIQRLASLPSREGLMGMLAGAMQAPMQAFVGALDSMLYQFVGALEAYRTQREETA